MTEAMFRDTKRGSEGTHGGSKTTVSKSGDNSNPKRSPLNAKQKIFVLWMRTQHPDLQLPPSV